MAVGRLQFRFTTPLGIGRKKTHRRCFLLRLVNWICSRALTAICHRRTTGGLAANRAAELRLACSATTSMGKSSPWAVRRGTTSGPWISTMMTSMTHGTSGSSCRRNRGGPVVSWQTHSSAGASCCSAGLGLPSRTSCRSCSGLMTAGKGCWMCRSLEVL